MAARSIAAYLPVEGSVVRLGTERDERGRLVTTWACPDMSVDAAHRALRATADRMGRTYTHPSVFQGIADGASWADPVTDPAEIDWTARRAAAAIPFEATAREHEAIVRDSIRETDDR